MKVSPPTSFIHVAGDDLVLKTQPFYSIFYDVDDKTNTTIKQQIRRGASLSKTKVGEKSCRDIVRNTNEDYRIINHLPFHIYGDSRKGTTNFLLFMVTLITTIVVGYCCFYYWTILLGDHVLVPSFQNVMEARCLYLSICFFFLTWLFIMLFYELLTLKRLSLPWFKAYQGGYSKKFYEFLLNQRKFFIWFFVLFWLAVVLFVTIVISKRVVDFKKQIAVNVVSLVVLFSCQYLYYQTTNRYVKTFCLFLSLFVISLVVVLLFQK